MGPVWVNDLGYISNPSIIHLANISRLFTLFPDPKGEAKIRKTRNQETVQKPRCKYEWVMRALPDKIQEGQLNLNFRSTVNNLLV